MKKFLKLALLVGGIAAVAKLVGAKKAEWAGLTESEVRAKLDARLPDRMPAREANRRSRQSRNQDAGGQGSPARGS